MGFLTAYITPISLSVYPHPVTLEMMHRGTAFITVPTHKGFLVNMDRTMFLQILRRRKTLPTVRADMGLFDRMGLNVGFVMIETKKPFLTVGAGMRFLIGMRETVSV